ncbi:MAG: deoxyribose-phosphate aldolase [Bacilli bacterium]|jgi:deoxyribose-phosphate aldolase|nr:deoxyribose-phosphate aldolase [Bacilli bacterium]
MKINKLIDHTLLKAFATKADIEKLCREAVQYDFQSVCVNPANVSLAKNFLKGSNVLVCTVIGFPLGANTIETKMVETADAIKNGADEIDMVINISKAKEREYKYIEEEIKAVVSASQGRTVKVILETCYLSEDEKIACCLAAQRAGAQFVKTSTGFGTGGAIITDVLTMRQAVGPNMGVKASGGIKTKADVDAFVKAGATRIGTSNGVQIMTDSAPQESY